MDSKDNAFDEIASKKLIVEAARKKISELEQAQKERPLENFEELSLKIAKQVVKNFEEELAVTEEKSS